MHDRALPDRALVDPKLLARYMDTFYGYGNYQGRYWFVGMEEGGGGREGNTVGELQRRVANWERGGSRELEDLAGYHGGIQAPMYFTGHPPIQPTWGKLIRILLAAQAAQAVQAGEAREGAATDEAGEDRSGRATLEAVRAYQRDRLGRTDPSVGETCLLELLPLPSPSAGRWAYSSLSALPQLGQLETRETYRENYAPARAEHIADRIKQYRPAAVVFYSYNPWYRRWWEFIAGPAVSFVMSAPVAGGARGAAGAGSFLLGDNGHTVFAIIKHPASHGLTSAYFQQVGHAISRRVLATGLE